MNTDPSEARQNQDKLDRYLKYLEYTPDNLNLIYDSIILAVDLSELDTARGLVQKGLALAPENANLHAHKGFLHLAENKLELAEEAFEQSIELGINNSPTLYNLAYTQFLRGKYQKAIDTLTKIEIPDSFGSEINILFLDALKT